MNEFINNAYTKALSDISEVKELAQVRDTLTEQLAVVNQELAKVDLDKRLKDLDDIIQVKNLIDHTNLVRRGYEVSDTQESTPTTSIPNIIPTEGILDVIEEKQI